MNELITLTEHEQYLQNADFTMTLKDVADKYGKENYNLVNDFNKMTSSLTEKSFNALTFQGVNYTDKKGELRRTISMDFLTFVWFIAKFDHEIRLQIVSFAFSKYQKEQEQKLIEVKKMANMVRIHEDGTTSITGLRQHYGFPESYETIKDALTWKGVMDVDIKITTRPTMNSDYQGIVYKPKTFVKDNTAKTTDYGYMNEPTRVIVDQYLSAGSPDVNEDFKDRMRNQLEIYLQSK